MRAEMEAVLRSKESRERTVCLEEGEDPAYLQEQLLTYIGNKRSLLPHLGNAIAKVKKRLGKERLRILDAFSGSGVVSRYCKAHAEYLAANDIEDYAAAVSRCHLRNRSEVDLVRLRAIAEELYLTTLTRLPDESETRDVSATISAQPPEKLNSTLSDMAWGLITSNEFRFAH